MSQVPPEVYAVSGCNCGGLQWHREDCSIWSIPHAEWMAALDAAEARLAAYVAAMNASVDWPYSPLPGMFR